MNEGPKASKDWYKPMTRKQLRDVTAFYAGHFPGWEIVAGRTTFARREFPIEQFVWFQPMGSGSYRPTHAIRALPFPEGWPAMLHRTPRHPMSVDYRWHTTNWETMLAAMERDFQPNMREPIDIAHVLWLCENSAYSKSELRPNDLAMLAILNAWLGRNEEALDYCRQIQVYSNPYGLNEHQQKIFAYEPGLRKAIEEGQARTYLIESATNPGG